MQPDGQTPPTQPTDDAPNVSPGHTFTTQGGGGQGRGGGHRWRSGPPTCYHCGSVGHIATNCSESYEDAKRMLEVLQQDQQQPQPPPQQQSTQCLMSGNAPDIIKDHDIFWQLTGSQECGTLSWDHSEHLGVIR